MNVVKIAHPVLYCVYEAKTYNPLIFFLSCYLHPSLFYPWTWKQYFLPKQKTFPRPHSIRTKKTRSLPWEPQISWDLKYFNNEKLRLLWVYTVTKKTSKFHSSSLVSFQVQQYILLLHNPITQQQDTHQSQTWYFVSKALGYVNKYLV